MCRSSEESGRIGTISDQEKKEEANGTEWVEDITPDLTRTEG